MPLPPEREALYTAEAILSLLHHRGIVDSDLNRRDVAEALTEVRAVLGIGGTYTATPKPPEPVPWWKRILK